MNHEEKTDLQKLLVDVAVLKALGKRNEALLQEVRREVIKLQIKNAGIAASVAIFITVAARFL